MTRVSEHEEIPEDRLHAALGEQVEHLTIGASPVSAVLRDGGALRVRRRLAVTSGVATLAVLPVAAVAVFGLGGTGSGGEQVRAGATGSGAGQVQTGTARTSPDQAKVAGTATTKPTQSTPATKLLPARTGTHVNRDADHVALPNPLDDYRVVATGTLGSQHWRLVRDRFVVETGAQPSSPGAPNNHLPQSKQRQAGTDSCESLGLQWGDGQVGAYPDFAPVMTCGTYDQVYGDGTLVMNAADEVGKFGTTLTEMFGRVDAARVATVTLSIGDRSTAPEPVYHENGQSYGYYVFLVDRSVNDGDNGYKLTLRDSAGNVVDTVNRPDMPPPSG
ncbi:MAG: hypothetical protein HOV83_21020 [Catenulispora sp.]|nr:hypothetical protein [Catenulispora sp.]